MSQPFKIFAYLGARAVGDSLLFHLFAGSIKRCFENAHLTVYFQDDRPYKMPMVQLNPYIDQWLTSTKEQGPYLLDWFDVGWQAPFDFPTNDWQQKGLGYYDFMLLPSMMSNEALASFEDPARLTFPDWLVPEYYKRLVDAGVNPDKWFCCMHIRQEGYEFRKTTSPLKNISNPYTYYELVQYITEKLGGQVVRLGDPTNTEFPKTPGLIDLSRSTQDFMLHAFASYRCRFFIGTDSGAYSIADSFGVPLGRTNVLSPPSSWGSYISLTKKIIAPNGEVCCQEAACNAGLLTEYLPVGYRLEENTAQELCAMAEALYETTHNCQGWRQHDVQAPPRNPPNSFSWPRPMYIVKNHRWL